MKQVYLVELMANTYSHTIVEKRATLLMLECFTILLASQKQLLHLNFNLALHGRWIVPFALANAKSSKSSSQS